jgi:hypothetical protein
LCGPRADGPRTEFVRPELNNDLLVGGIGVLTDWDPAALGDLRAVVSAE